MAWRGGRCLAALYLETAAGLRQRSVRKEEALAASAFEKMKSVGDTQHFDPALERAKLEAIRDAMIEDMLKRGYNPNYLNEIRNCDIQKIQMR